MGSVLLINGSGTLSTTEQGFADLITGAGHTVTVVDDNAVTDPATFSGHACFVLLESASSTTMGTKGAGLSLGAVVCENGAWDTEYDLMTGSVSATTSSLWNIVDATHPIITGAGINATGTVSVVSSSVGWQTTSTATLPAGGVPLACAASNTTTNRTLVAYPSGGTLADGAAAAGRRVLFSLNSTSAGQNSDLANDTLKALFLQSVLWAGSLTGGSNTAPTANAGPDQTVAQGVTVTLTGAASTDSDGTIASYAWTQTAGTAVTLSSATAASPTFTAPGTAQTLTFSLVVTDNGGAASSADTVNVVVTASASAQTFSSWERTGWTIVGGDGTALTTMADADDTTGLLSSANPTALTLTGTLKAIEKPAGDFVVTVRGLRVNAASSTVTATLLDAGSTPLGSAVTGTPALGTSVGAQTFTIPAASFAATSDAQWRAGTMKVLFTVSASV